MERAFIVMQVGAKESPERKRADEVFEYVVKPTVQEVKLEAYRADLDISPGAITPKFLSELITARLVIADLTGRNPNVYYELGITHSFSRPLILIADSTQSIPFDAKDERVIELGDYPDSGLPYAQGERAKASLRESLKIVLGEGYLPPSPLRELAANRSIDQLAPDNPIAAELAQIRANIEKLDRPRSSRDISRDTETMMELQHRLEYIFERNEAVSAQLRASVAELAVISSSRAPVAGADIAGARSALRELRAAVDELAHEIPGIPSMGRISGLVRELERHIPLSEV